MALRWASPRLLQFDYQANNRLTKIYHLHGFSYTQLTIYLICCPHQKPAALATKTPTASNDDRYNWKHQLIRLLSCWIEQNKNKVIHKNEVVHWNLSSIATHWNPRDVMRLRFLWIQLDQNHAYKFFHWLMQTQIDWSSSINSNPDDQASWSSHHQLISVSGESLNGSDWMKLAYPLRLLLLTVPKRECNDI